MSKLRRGLLAAGLATAVAGSTGVLWTLNASAAEAPVVAPSIAEHVPAMPKLLPWGDKPSPIKRGKPGASSKAVTAAGADAAPSDTSGSLLPVPEFAPKGLLAEEEAPRRARTAAPPSPAAAAAQATEDDKTKYFYAGARQHGETDGSWANLHIAKPEVAQDDHSLAEIAVQSADGDQTVEVGWTVDRSVNNDADPHLFVFHWRDDVPGCYNACGFVQVSKNIKPGDTLPLDAYKRFGIQHFDGVWWVAYNSEYIGYFPDKLWDGKYTRAGLVQWFGEVASDSSAPCTDMGNGTTGLSELAIRFGTVTQKNGPEVEFEMHVSHPEYYQAKPTSSGRTLHFGGLGNGKCA